ncbi:MAG: flagellin, partial [Shewanella fodinae]|nr:flagellin [Shewanella fodinae]
SADGTEISMGLGSAATATAAQLNKLGFNESTGSDDVIGGSVSTAAVTDNDGIQINGVKLGAVTGNSAADKAFAINALREQTGVEASAKTEVKLGMGLPLPVATSTSTINGVALTGLSAAATVDSAVDIINSLGIAGVVASADEDGKLVLTSQSGQDIKLDDAAGVFSGGTTTFTGEITLKGQNGRDVVITSNASDQAAQTAALTKLGLGAQGGNENCSRSWSEHGNCCQRR